jgi:ribosomal protein S12 methylthiotransferase accessory factor YcaO
VIIVDLTDLRVCIPVVRVVIPGLECAEGTQNYRFGSRAATLIRQRLTSTLDARSCGS